MGLTLEVLEARAVEDFAGVMSAASGAGAQAVVLLPAPLLSRNAKHIASLALQRRLPTLFYSVETIRDGGLMSYGASLIAIYRRAAYYVDRIAKGARPADLPVEQPTKFDLAINLKTAKTLGITVPPTLLARADEVIE
jgi:putative ABC transport system substrate-binding protein